MKNSIDSVAKTANTQTITIAALVTTPAVERIPSEIASSIVAPLLEPLADPADDEHVVVHREAEQDHEQKQRDHGRDAGRVGEPEQALADAVLEDQHEDPVGRGDRQAVEHDRLQRDDDRAERDQHQREREHEHERDHERQCRPDLVARVLPLGGQPGDAGLRVREGADRLAG